MYLIGLYTLLYNIRVYARAVLCNMSVAVAELRLAFVFLFIGAVKMGVGN